MNSAPRSRVLFVKHMIAPTPTNLFMDRSVRSAWKIIRYRQAIRFMNDRHG